MTTKRICSDLTYLSMREFSIVISAAAFKHDHLWSGHICVIMIEMNNKFSNKSQLSFKDFKNHCRTTATFLLNVEMHVHVVTISHQLMWLDISYMSY